VVIGSIVPKGKTGASCGSTAITTDSLDAVQEAEFASHPPERAIRLASSSIARVDSRARSTESAERRAARKSAKLRVGPLGVPVFAGREPDPALIAVFIANPSNRRVNRLIRD
jgi:hypothetical protein